jgi:glutaredoxin 2
MKLYHYPHCPFCQRVRLFLEFKKIPYESIELSYADIETPTKLIGQKMLPIIEFDDGTIMGESLDLLREIEQRHPQPIGYIGPVEGPLQWSSMAVVGIPGYFDLVLPWYLEHYRQEFVSDPKGKAYYREGKEAKRGITFEALKAKRIEIFNDQVLPHLEEILEKVEDQYFVMGPTFSVADCVLAADLNGLRLVPDIALPPEIPAYIKRVEKHCHTSLLEN